MIKIEEIFVKYKVAFHGADMWVILICDNFKAHVNDQVQNIFGYAKGLLYYLPNNMTEVVQQIDAGYGRSLRCNMGNVLDIWLMSEEDLSKWEGKITAAYRGILVT